MKYTRTATPTDVLETLKNIIKGCSPPLCENPHGQ